MSGVNFNSTSYSTRLNEIESALMTPKSKKVVNDKLEIVKKDNGFLRFLKVMVLPLARFFGADPFAHTRANKVATALLAEYQKLEDELSAEDKNRLSRIVTKLDQKTKNRYHKVMDVFIKMIPVDPSISAPVFTSTKPGAFTPPPVPMGPDGKPLPPPPVFVSTPKDPMQALKDQIAKNKGETAGSGETGDTSATDKPVAKPANPAAELADLLKGGGINSLLKKAQQTEEKKEDSEDVEGSGEVDPWAAFGAKKNEETTAV